MRIVYITPKAGDAFGQERVLKDTCVLLKSAGQEVFLIAESRTGELPPHDGIFYVEGISALHSLSNPKRVAQLHGRVMSHLEEIKPDVVHFFDQFDFRLMHAVCRRYPTYFTAHTVAPSCPSSARLIPGNTVCVKQSGWQCVKHNREYHCLDFCRTNLRRYHAVHNFLLRRRALMEMRGVIAISDYVREILIRDGFSPKQVVRIYNPVALSPLRKSDTVERPENLIVVAARLVSLKGIDWLIRALKAVADLPWTVWVLGDGVDREKLIVQRDRLGLTDRVQFKGRMSYAQTQAIMAAAEIVVQTNIGPEGFGLSIAEASALAKPVVTFNLPAFNELILDGESGYLIPTRDLPKLTRALRELITRPELRLKLGERGRKHMQEKFAPPRYLEQLLAFYRAGQVGRFDSDLVSDTGSVPVN